MKCPSCESKLLRKMQLGKRQDDVTGFLYFTCEDPRCSLYGKQLDINLKVKDMSKEFQEGNDVRRVSGGPVMTIVELSGTFATCQEVINRVSSFYDSKNPPAQTEYKIHIISLAELERVDRNELE